MSLTMFQVLKLLWIWITRLLDYLDESCSEAWLFALGNVALVGGCLLEKLSSECRAQILIGEQISFHCA